MDIKFMSVCGCINSTLFYSCHCLFAHNPTISEVSQVFSKHLQKPRKNLLCPERRPCAVHVQVWRTWEFPCSTPLAVVSLTFPSQEERWSLSHLKYPLVIPMGNCSDASSGFHQQHAHLSTVVCKGLRWCRSMFIIKVCKCCSAFYCERKAGCFIWDFRFRACSRACCLRSVFEDGCLYPS